MGQQDETMDEPGEWAMEIPSDPLELLYQLGEDRRVALILDPAECALRIAVVDETRGTDLAVLFGVLLRVWLPQDIDVAQVRAYLLRAESRELLARIADGHELYRENSGVMRGELTRDADEAFCELTGSELHSLTLHHGEGWEADEWLDPSLIREGGRRTIIGSPPDLYLTITPETTEDELRVAAERVVDDARRQHIAVRGVRRYLYGLREEVIVAKRREEEEG